MTTVAYAQLGKVLKGGAIAIAVDQFGPQINSALNRLMGSKNLGPEQATKVVPILSIGSGSYLGAVQVTGPDEVLDRVKAVAFCGGDGYHGFGVERGRGNLLGLLLGRL